MVRFVDMRQPDLRVQPVRPDISRFRRGPCCRLFGHSALLSLVPLILFSGKCETDRQPACRLARVPHTVPVLLRLGLVPHLAYDDMRGG